MALLKCEKFHIAIDYPYGNLDLKNPMVAYCCQLPKGLPMKATNAISMKPNKSAVPGVHPSYLDSLALTHSSWVFGAIAELIDNARDANASRYVK